MKIKSRVKLLKYLSGWYTSKWLPELQATADTSTWEFRRMSYRSPKIEDNKGWTELFG